MIIAFTCQLGDTIRRILHSTACGKVAEQPVAVLAR